MNKLRRAETLKKLAETKFYKDFYVAKNDGGYFAYYCIEGAETPIIDRISKATYLELECEFRSDIADKRNLVEGV